MSIVNFGMIRPLRSPRSPGGEPVRHDVLGSKSTLEVAAEKDAGSMERQGRRRRPAWCEVRGSIR